MFKRNGCVSNDKYNDERGQHVVSLWDEMERGKPAGVGCSTSCVALYRITGVDTPVWRPDQHESCCAYFIASRPRRHPGHDNTHLS